MLHNKNKPSTTTTWGSIHNVHWNRGGSMQDYLKGGGGGGGGGHKRSVCEKQCAREARSR